MSKSVFDEQRRKFIGTSMAVASGAAVVGSGLVGCAQAQTQAGSVNSGRSTTSVQISARRKFGQL